MGAGERISYKEFRDRFLIELVLLVKGDTNTQTRASAVAAAIPEGFLKSWPEEAAKDLEMRGLVRRYAVMGGNSILHVTGSGLEEAEELGGKYGYPELHEEIAERNSAEAPPAVVPLDQSSAAFKALDAEMAKIIAELRGSNSLSAASPSEASQRITELEAGRALLQAEQIDRSLVERMLLVPLRWALSKAAEETLKIAVGAALKLAAAYFWLKP